MLATTLSGDTQEPIAVRVAKTAPLMATVKTVTAMRTNDQFLPKALLQRTSPAVAQLRAKLRITGTQSIGMNQEGLATFTADKLDTHAQSPPIESRSTRREVRRLTSVELLAWRAADPSRAPMYYNRKVA
jgi:hypothetical protein